MQRIRRFTSVSRSERELQKLRQRGNGFAHTVVDAVRPSKLTRFSRVPAVLPLTPTVSLCLHQLQVGDRDGGRKPNCTGLLVLKRVTEEEAQDRAWGLVSTSDFSFG